MTEANRFRNKETIAAEYARKGEVTAYEGEFICNWCHCDYLVHTHNALRGLGCVECGEHCAASPIFNDISGKSAWYSKDQINDSYERIIAHARKRK